MLTDLYTQSKEQGEAVLSLHKLYLTPIQYGVIFVKNERITNIFARIVKSEKAYVSTHFFITSNKFYILQTHLKGLDFITNFAYTYRQFLKAGNILINFI